MQWCSQQCCSNQSGEAAVPVGSRNVIDVDEKEEAAMEAAKAVEAITEGAVSDTPNAAPEAIESQTNGFEAGCCRILFDIGGGRTKELTFTFQPLGIAFENKMPIVVKGVLQGTAGAKEGVQINWAFKSIDGVSLQNMEFNDAKKVLVDRISTLQRRVCS
mmetsp:Transcript_154266/g.287611  ORF Transcript_154266/g.287611 Transcript_154266/m.287611 type:complete len:160 (-) Transcript_154266:39-518(-)